MVCVLCAGLLALSLVCLGIFIRLAKKYIDKKNKFTIYLAIYFLIGFLSWGFWFLTTEWVLNIEEDMMAIVRFTAILTQLTLLLFILDFFDTSLIIRGVLFITVLLCGLIFALFSSMLFLFLIVTTLLTITNIVLFLSNWRKNNDNKSLAFSIGLISLFLGGSLSNISSVYNGIFLILTAIIWGIAFSGLFDRKDV